MRKIIVLSMITLDGVMQAPGGPKEDTSEGFNYGGWTAQYFDKAYSKVAERKHGCRSYTIHKITSRMNSGDTLHKPQVGHSAVFDIYLFLFS